VIKNFQWDVIVYDEMEEFSQETNHPNLTSPFTERKHRINYMRPTPVVTKQIVQDIYLRRNVVCLQEKQYTLG